jgi:hypothetical protein
MPSAVFVQFNGQHRSVAAVESADGAVSSVTTGVRPATARRSGQPSCSGPRNAQSLSQIVANRDL